MRHRNFVYRKGIWFLILFAGSLYSFFSITKHLRFNSFGFDLGIYDQLIWLVSRGQTLYSSVLDYHPWGDHLTPSLVFLSPLYWLWDDVIILLLFQAFFVASGAFPIFLLAKEKIKDEFVALTVAVGYLTFFGIQNAIAFDFHPLVLATTLLAWLFYLYERKKWLIFWLVLVLFLGLQENLALTTVALGFYFLLKNRDFRRGLVMIFLGTGWFLLAIFVLIPHFRGESFLYWPAHWQGMTPLDLLKNFFYPASKIQVIFFSFLGFGFLPIFAPFTWIILFEEFFQRFISSSSTNRWELGYHYNVILAPILVIGTIYAIEKFFKKRKKTAALIILTGVILVQILTKPSLNDLLKKDFYDFSRRGKVEKFLKLIPPQATVAATNNLVPHLSHRQEIVLLTNCLEDKTLWKGDMKRCYDLEPEFMMADFNLQGSANNFYPDNSKEAIRRYFDLLQNSGKYSLFSEEGEPLVVLIREKL